MTNYIVTLPLELLLQSQSSDCEQFPDREQDYFDRYLGIKQWLTKNVYRGIGAATSRDGGFYTDHDLSHFEAVIRAAGRLIGLSSSECQTSPLAPYEVYLLLVGILLHDAGNIFGRHDHEKNAFRILKVMGEMAGGDDREKKRIANIAQAHGGKFAGDKDTIVNLCKEKDSYLSIPYRERLIAAIVRFADEICEDRSRANRFLAENGKISDESKIHHAYALSISSVDIEPSEELIKMNFSVKTEDLPLKYPHPDVQDGEYLIDYIKQRLNKTYLELLYCIRFMREVVLITRIDVTIDIVNKDYDIVGTYPLRFQESGYPKVDRASEFFSEDLTGEKVMLKFQVQNEHG